MVSSLVLNVGAGEFSEGNAVAWGAFASDNAAVSVSDDARRVRVGAQSVRLVTASGFDTGVRYPAAPTAHWNASTNTHLAFWTFADNTNSAGFQGNQPVVVLKTAGGSYRYEPAGNETHNRVWAFHRVPLAGDARWTRTTTGAPTLGDVNQIEIHQDTWDYGFTIYYDGLEFASIASGGNPPPGPPPPPGVNPDLVRARALLFVYDPIMENKGGQRMHAAYHLGDPVQLTERIVSDFRSNSHGLFLPHVVETNIVDGYWFHRDGFQYDDTTYDQAVTTGQYHSSGFDYVRFIADNGIATRVLSGDLDEIWLYQGVGAGTWESTMAGDGGYWCNSSPVQGVPSERLVCRHGMEFRARRRRGDPFLRPPCGEHHGPLLQAVGAKPCEQLERVHAARQGCARPRRRRQRAFPGERAVGLRLRQLARRREQRGRLVQLSQLPRRHALV